MDITIERVFIWIVIGLFICYKRKWYIEDGTDDMPKELICLIAVVGMPINFAIVFFKMFIINKWNDEKIK
jgi:RsiW-degrading membrane proteinase PrsW (M82 family)